MPIILNGVLIGFFASLIALGAFVVFLYYFNSVLEIYRIIPFRIRYFLAGILLLGPVLGLFVSFISLRRISLKI